MLSGERLNAIRALVLTEQAGSFAKAGERLGLSPSAVGKAISRLETRLGVRLFHRTTRSLSLTDEGQRYHESCVRALAELEAAELAIARGKAEPSGRLRVSLPDLLGRRILAPILFGVARTHPGIELDLSFENRMVDLAEDAVDLAIRIGALSETSGLVARRIGFQDLVLCASPDYLERAPPLLDWKDLAHHALVTQGRGDGDVPWLRLDDRGAPRPVSVRGRHRFTTIETIADAAVAAMGVAQLPRWLVAEAVAVGNLAISLPDLPQPRLPIHALWLPTHAMAPRVRVAIDTIFREMNARGTARFADCE